LDSDLGFVVVVIRSDSSPFVIRRDWRIRVPSPESRQRRTYASSPFSDKIRIRLRPYDYRVLDSRRPRSSTRPSAPARASRGRFFADGEEQVDRAPSPHVDKKSREQFEIRSHKRSSTSRADAADSDALMKLDLPAAWTWRSRRFGKEHK